MAFKEFERLTQVVNKLRDPENGCPWDLELAKRQEAEDEISAGKMKIEWGAQIRSYVLHPYKLVKDHRTNHEVGNAEKILDGDLDSFMDSFLRWSVSKGIEEENA